ncbi:hypothetical protein LguiB_004290 [Lonicera macranthoides]
MGKKRSWFSVVKGLFIPVVKSKEEKGPRRWRWVFSRLKLRQYPALAEPEKTLIEVTEEQRKHAFAVAIATASAAEAAVAAANAAAEVVRLTCFPVELEKRNRNFAATQIQSAFRAHLAKKALKALKGIVKLQAVVRGQIIRQRIITKLRCLQSVAKTHSQVHIQSVGEGCKNSKKKEILTAKKELVEKEIKLDCKSQRNWDFMFLKEEKEAARPEQQEFTKMRKDCMRKYPVSHRERGNGRSLEELLTHKEEGRKSHRFEKWENIEAHTRIETEKLKSTIHSNSFNSAATHGTRLKRANELKQYSVEESNSPVSLPRRSFCRVKRQESARDESSLPNSPIFPTYMAATESAKAKVRSLSTPRQRLAFLDVYGLHSSSFKPNISSWSSFNGELTNANGSNGNSQHTDLRPKQDQSIGKLTLYGENMIYSLDYSPAKTVLPGQKSLKTKSEVKRQPGPVSPGQGVATVVRADLELCGYAHGFRFDSLLRETFIGPLGRLPVEQPGPHKISGEGPRYP